MTLESERAELLADEHRIDRLRLVAFKSNDDKDRQTYFDVVSKWFQDRHYRRLAAQPLGDVREAKTLIDARLEDLETANSLYGKDQCLSAPDKIDRNKREISWLKDLRSILAIDALVPAGGVGEAARLINATTVSCSGKTITIECDDHDVKDALMNWIVELAYGPALATQNEGGEKSESQLVKEEIARLNEQDAEMSQGETEFLLEAKIIKPSEATPAPADETCTDCGGSGVTYQTERPCSCQPAPADDAAVAWRCRCMIHARVPDIGQWVYLEKKPEPGVWNKIEPLYASPAKAVDVEAIAKHVYDAFPFFPTLGAAVKPDWVTGGNSVMQDEARAAARKIAALTERGDR